MLAASGGVKKSSLFCWLSLLLPIRPKSYPNPTLFARPPLWTDSVPYFYPLLEPYIVTAVREILPTNNNNTTLLLLLLLLLLLFDFRIFRFLMSSCFGCLSFLLILYFADLRYLIVRFLMFRSFTRLLCFFIFRLLFFARQSGNMSHAPATDKSTREDFHNEQCDAI